MGAAKDPQKKKRGTSAPPQNAERVWSCILERKAKLADGIPLYCMMEVQQAMTESISLAKLTACSTMWHCLEHKVFAFDHKALLQGQPAGSSGVTSGQPHRRKQEAIRKPTDGRIATVPGALDAADRAEKQNASASFSGRGSAAFPRAERGR